MTELDVNPTRMELLILKDKKKLAEKGHKLLKNKQDALILNFFQKIKELKIIQEKLSDDLKNAYDSLVIAETLDGAANVKSAAYNFPPSFEFVNTNENIMGVKVQKIDVKELDLSDVEFLGGSNQLIDAHSKFKRAMGTIVKATELENTIKKIGDEIKKTKRRLNSLEYIKIPQLSDAYTYIKMSLAEAERENFFRLKIIKEMLEQTAAAEEAEELAEKLAKSSSKKAVDSDA